LRNGKTSRTKSSIENGLFCPVLTIVNDDKRILTFANVHKAIITVLPSRSCVCVRLHVTVKVQTKCKQSEMTRSWARSRNKQNRLVTALNSRWHCALRCARRVFYRECSKHAFRSSNALQRVYAVRAFAVDIAVPAWLSSRSLLNHIERHENHRIRFNHRRAAVRLPETCRA
jgi:hypothetical protein